MKRLLLLSLILAAALYGSQRVVVVESFTSVD